MRTGVIGTLAASLLLCAAGCGKRPGPAGTADLAPASTARLTVLVKDMTKVLKIT
jgi:hypothetical protein